MPEHGQTPPLILVHGETLGWRQLSTRSRRDRSRRDSRRENGRDSTRRDKEIDADMMTQDPAGPPATSSSPPGTGTVTDERMLGAQLFNETWRLLDQESRSPADDDRMLHTAHASRYHWGQVRGVTPAHLARGEWQVSRVYAVLGRPEPALHHARRVLDICRANSIADWDLGFAYEALARAAAAAGDARATGEYLAQARAAAEHIAADEDRDLLLTDLATIAVLPPA